MTALEGLLNTKDYALLYAIWPGQMAENVHGQENSLCIRLRASSSQEMKRINCDSKTGFKPSPRLYLSIDRSPLCLTMQTDSPHHPSSSLRPNAGKAAAASLPYAHMRHADTIRPVGLNVFGSAEQPVPL
ncbi:hypothetical protein BO83DRAFT_386489 [Aspergillus eucalypticola CBS 122712]|uniref:Uncharacterized protein n=1 Tax=Aspergillus eucalypticola (strain CBS 122712 / IBT 29274) TaxID=1448314 RepID=A0A317VYE0_ASPEC|nr:uncharacterized protein BO83DRAFT_386489 [Aspergillus eucalypticola CBS 122712]PWY78795.1 hypothetical protein BO83DRAFT_386489 [Aspergillus eucalypticola CBS 122712]